MNPRTGRVVIESNLDEQIFFTERSGKRDRISVGSTDFYESGTRIVYVHLSASHVDPQLKRFW